MMAPYQRVSYRGVTQHRDTQQYEAHLCEEDGTQLYLGAFDSAMLAARSYDVMLIRRKGMQAEGLNFPAAEYGPLIPAVTHMSDEEVLSTLVRCSATLHQQQHAQHAPHGQHPKHPKSMCVKEAGVHKPTAAPGSCKPCLHRPPGPASLPCPLAFAPLLACGKGAPSGAHHRPPGCCAHLPMLVALTPFGPLCWWPAPATGKRPAAARPRELPQPDTPQASGAVESGSGSWGPDEAAQPMADDPSVEEAAALWEESCCWPTPPKPQESLQTMLSQSFCSPLSRDPSLTTVDGEPGPAAAGPASSCPAGPRTPAAVAGAPRAPFGRAVGSGPLTRHSGACSSWVDQAAVQLLRQGQGGRSAQQEDSDGGATQHAQQEGGPRQQDSAQQDSGQQEGPDLTSLDSFNLDRMLTLLAQDKSLMPTSRGDPRLFEWFEESCNPGGCASGSAGSSGGSSSAPTAS